MKTRITRVILASCVVLSLVTGCEKKLSVQEYLQLGQKYLIETDYGAGIRNRNAVILISGKIRSKF